MKDASFVLAVVAAATGLFAAWKWYKASKVEITPLWQQLGVIEPPGGDPNGWVIGILQASQKSAELNKTAAAWTAISVCLGWLSFLAGSI
ncbi:hypothetical protein [Mesorhizobium sp. GbtcB19]|uniref:hypothetical protein n=1 Tax=Mesorhizobium sp. GbtcB19 TaxID=2824764 RepID=UPI001C30E121|nr:hypothetical protein [Mesorhizobium sp. GbtcB19]